MVPTCLPAWLAGPRFIKNNLIVEITSSARLARMFGWLLKRHTILSFYLYTAGFVRWAGTQQPTPPVRPGMGTPPSRPRPPPTHPTHNHPHP